MYANAILFSCDHSRCGLLASVASPTLEYAQIFLIQVEGWGISTAYDPDSRKHYCPDHVAENLPISRQQNRTQA